jgi:hypothetical protein
MSIHACTDALLALTLRLRTARGGSLHTTSPSLERWLESFNGRPGGAPEGWLSGRERLRVTSKAVSRLAVDRDEDQVGDVLAQMLLEDLAHAARAQARGEESGKARVAAEDSGLQKDRPGQVAPGAAVGAGGRGRAVGLGMSPALQEVAAQSTPDGGRRSDMLAAEAAATALPAIA